MDWAEIKEVYGKLVPVLHILRCIVQVHLLHGILFGKILDIDLYRVVERFRNWSISL
jgi:hypothetical protein